MNVKNNTNIYTHRVIYADTDQMGIVYHGRYFEWLEAARTELMRIHGMSYNTLEARGISLPVIEASCRYIRAFKYDDIVNIIAEIEDVTRSRLKIKYELYCEGDETARVKGVTVHCYMNRQARAIRAPRDLLLFFKSFQVPENME
ncbi:acyl-CoA thioesterase [bacterium]|nr:acyl-CoA thioesterase [bacterium]